MQDLDRAPGWAAENQRSDAKPGGDNGIGFVCRSKSQCECLAEGLVLIRTAAGRRRVESAGAIGSSEEARPLRSHRASPRDLGQKQCEHRAVRGLHVEKGKQGLLSLR